MEGWSLFLVECDKKKPGPMLPVENEVAGHVDLILVLLLTTTTFFQRHVCPSPGVLTIAMVPARHLIYTIVVRTTTSPPAPPENVAIAVRSSCFDSLLCAEARCSLNVKTAETVLSCLGASSPRARLGFRLRSMSWCEKIRSNWRRCYSVSCDLHCCCCFNWTAKVNLPVREDKKIGVYVAGATEEYVTSADEVRRSLCGNHPVGNVYTVQPCVHTNARGGSPERFPGALI